MTPPNQAGFAVRNGRLSLRISYDHGTWLPAGSVLDVPDGGSLEAEIGPANLAPVPASAEAGQLLPVSPRTRPRLQSV